MSRAFSWFLLVVSVVMLAIGLTHLDETKPAVMFLWVVVCGAAVYTLFFKRSRAK